MISKYRTLFLIINAALTDISVVVDDTLDYAEIFEVGKKHQIIPLVYCGIQKLKGDSEEVAKFQDYTLRLFYYDFKQIECLNRIEEEFSNNRIDYMLLKGASIKKIYPSSELRLMGDIDILIKEEQYEQIRKILCNIDLCEVNETDHELIWRSRDGILVELHKRLIPSYNDDYYSYYCNSWEKSIIEKGYCYAMSAEDEYIYIFTHLTKHYRDGGIGLKHMIDVWYFALKHPSLDMEYINCELSKLSLKRFHKNILDTLEVWFHGKASTDITDYITERIIESGAYGIKEKWDIANAARERAKTTSVASAKRKNMISLIFMPYSNMQKKYPVLKKAPFLLPIMWVVRWGDAIINKQSNISRQAERLNKIESEYIDGYNRELEMVGLKFDLKVTS
jgi:hypothetical protein